MEEAAQKKAAQAPPVCPICGGQLSRVTSGHKHSYQTRFGEVTLRRARGWGRRGKAWGFPADHRLGVADTGGCSPGVQELAALGVSKLPGAEASAVIERLSGVKLPRATWDREARRPGGRAQAQREPRDEQMRRGGGADPGVPELRTPGPGQPFTRVQWRAAGVWINPQTQKGQSL